MRKIQRERQKEKERDEETEVKIDAEKQRGKKTEIRQQGHSERDKERGFITGWHIKFASPPPQIPCQVPSHCSLFPGPQENS